MPYCCAMTTLTITSKGQITLKKELLEHLGLKPGDRIEVAKRPNRGLSVDPASPQRVGRMSNAFGMLQRETQTQLTVEEMNNAIARDRAQDDERIRTDGRDRRR